MADRQDQRAALEPFLAALDGMRYGIRRDGCGDPRIEGKWGHVYAVPGGFQIYVTNEKGDSGAPWQWTTTRGWLNAKLALKFCKLTLDCEMEGLFFLDRLPSEKEAALIRQYCGIRRKPHYSEEVMAKFRANAPGRRAVNAAKTDGD